MISGYPHDFGNLHVFVVRSPEFGRLETHWRPAWQEEIIDNLYLPVVNEGGRDLRCLLGLIAIGLVCIYRIHGRISVCVSWSQVWVF